MVYCVKCGAKNEDDAAVCVKCGASLTVAPVSRRGRHEKGGDECFGGGRGRQEKGGEECFGLPHGGAIVGAIIGIIIVVVGISMIPGVIPPEWRDITGPLFWAIIVIIFGALIVAGVLYRYLRR